MSGDTRLISRKWQTAKQELGHAVGRKWLRLLLCTVVGLSSAAEAQAAGQLEYQLRHCPVEVTVADPDVLAHCRLSDRPAARNHQLSNDLQLMRLTLNNTDNKPRAAQIIIGPYYLAWIELFRPRNAVTSGTEIVSTSLATDAEYVMLPSMEASELTLIGRGGSFSQNEQTATLGGHVFTATLQPGRNDFLLRLQAPGFAHVSIQAYLTNPATPDTRLISISIHLGMLATLAGLALVGLLLRPTVINARLLLLNTIILAQVALGSGFVQVLMPEYAGHGAMTAFMALVILRSASWSWLYQALIEPHLTGPLYRRVCWLTYALCGVALGLFLLESLVAARALTFALIFGIPIVHTIAALRAHTLVPLTKHALLGSLVVYNILQAIAILLLTLETGQSNLPVWISRALDLLIPLLAMGTVLLRNRASDQYLAATEQELARNAAALEAESTMREEKRTLIDMLTHEVRNPLATIRLATRALQAQLTQDSASMRRRLSNINNAISTIDEVIERCDVHNSVEAAGLQPDIKRVDLTTLLTSIAERLNYPGRFDFQNHGPSRVESDPQLLEILLTNLMDNALKYSPSQTTITVEIFALAEPAGWGLRISNAIEPGMAPDAERLFQRYYRHEHARRQGGSGLGLSLCQRIAEILGGTLEYHPGTEQVAFELRMESLATC